MLPSAGVRHSSTSSVAVAPHGKTAAVGIDASLAGNSSTVSAGALRGGGPHLLEGDLDGDFDGDRVGDRSGDVEGDAAHAGGVKAAALGPTTASTSSPADRTRFRVWGGGVTVEA
jgi:hypothetical protein